MLPPDRLPCGLVTTTNFQKGTRKGAYSVNSRGADMTNLPSGPLNNPTAERYAVAIEAQGMYWCTVHHGGAVDQAVLEVRSRVRPMPLVRRCLTVEDCIEQLGYQIEGKSGVTNILAAFAQAQKVAGNSCYGAEKLARKSGHKVGRHAWRTVWSQV